MSDQIEEQKTEEPQTEATEESEEKPAEEQEKPSPEDESEEVEEEQEEESEESQEDEEGDTEELDLERAKAKIAKANDEAKNLRTRLREKEEALKVAKSPEEVEEAVTKATRDLLIENVALKHKLSEKVAKRLTGTTREELEADAKELADLFGSGDDDEDFNLEGGLNPRRREEEASDPRSLAQRHGARAKRR